MKFWVRVAFTLTLLIQPLGILGCFSSDIGGSFVDFQQTDTTAEGYRIYSEAGQNLVVSIPLDLTIQPEEIAEIYGLALQVPHCQNNAQGPIPIMLAQACILYDTFYLFPEFLPDSLDSIQNVEEYAAFMGQSDPFTFFYSTENFTRYKSFRDGDSAHIGFLYQFDGETVTEQTPFLIQEVYPFTRAWIDGLHPGDRIIAINGSDISGLTLEGITDLLPDQEGATVDILVSRNGQEISISTASEEHIAQLLSPGIAYLSVRSFIRDTGSQVKQDFMALQEASTEPIAGIILDLRDNPGGSVSGALQLADYLIDQDSPAKTNPIMIENGTYYQNSTRYLGDYDTTNIGDYSETSFVILVDAGTASAGEITTAALKFYNEATIMGVQTYGKGVSQFVFELVDGSGVWIPSHYVYPPDGISFHQVGIAPDFTITDQPVSFSQDPVLDNAVLFLQTGDVADAEPTRTQLSRPSLTEPDTDPLVQRLTRRGIFWR